MCHPPSHPLPIFSVACGDAFHQTSELRGRAEGADGVDEAYFTCERDCVSFVPGITLAAPRNNRELTAAHRDLDADAVRLYRWTSVGSDTQLLLWVRCPCNVFACLLFAARVLLQYGMTGSGRCMTVCMGPGSLK